MIIRQIDDEKLIFKTANSSKTQKIGSYKQNLTLAFAGELGLEFLYSTSGIHKAFFTSECWVRIHGDIAN